MSTLRRKLGFIVEKLLKCTGLCFRQNNSGNIAHAPHVIYFYHNKKYPLPNNTQDTHRRHLGFFFLDSHINFYLKVNSLNYFAKLSVFRSVL